MKKPMLVLKGEVLAFFTLLSAGAPESCTGVKPALV